MSETNYTKGQWVPDLNNGTYKNPILYADYSDPDVIRIGNDYFLIASSFNCTPGIPILHSKDLVNWKIVNYVFDKLPLEIYDTPQHGNGAWAPSIKYHDGKVWVFFCTPDEGIFMSNTTDPFGKWSELYHVKEACGWIDCCPFWDDDGKAYLLHAFAKSRAGINNILELCDMTPDGKSVSNRRIVANMNGKHIVVEGPKLFKRDGYYYISAPGGGIEHGYQIIMRSKNIDGPYEDRICLHEGNNINGPRQGGIVDTPKGEEWFIHFRDLGAYGRVTSLEPVHWKCGWPIIGVDIDNDGIGEPVAVYKKPDCPKQKIRIPQTSDSFESDELGKQWQWYANFKDDWYSLSERKGFLRLYAQKMPENQKLYDLSNILSQKFPSPAFTATAKVCTDIKTGVRAGLIVTGDSYEALYISEDENDLYLKLLVGCKDLKEDKVIETVKLSDAKNIFLRVNVGDKGVLTFCYSIDGKDFKKIGETYTAQKELWIGAKVGLYSVTTDNELSKDQFCDFESFTVE